MVPNYKIMTKRTCYSTDYSEKERHKLMVEQDKFLKKNGYDTWNKEYSIHFFDSHFFNETTENMDIETAIECLAIKDGVDVVQYENGNYGYVAYYNGYENGFEILGDAVEEDMKHKLKNKINLYDLLVISDNDYDAYDTEYDDCITVFAIDDEPEDFFDKFYREMCKKADVIEANGCSLTVNWCEIVQRNWDKFKAFTNEHWKYTYEDDDDEFVYQWIREINYYFAGYVSEDFYETLYNFALTLK